MTGNKKTLQIDLGPACNNNCIFCMEPRLPNHPPETPIGYFSAILKKNRPGFERVMFTHREPTLSRHLPKLIQEAGELGYPEIMLITNGRRLSYAAYLESLLSAGLNSLGISVHGHTQAVHEAMTRTPGSFRETAMALANAGEARQSGRLGHFTAHVTLSRLNFKYIEDIYYFLEKFGVDRVLFNLFDPRGEAEKLADSLMPDPVMVVEAVNAFEHSASELKMDLIGIPYCLGISRNNLGGVEEAYLDKRGETEQDNTLCREKEGVCRVCAYRGVCPGLDSAYLDKFGCEFIRPFINSGYTAVVAGIKPAHRGMVSKEHSELLSRFSWSQGLAIEFSDFGVGISERKTVFSDSSDSVFYYVARDSAKAIRLKELERKIFTTKGRHERETREMGEFLGYPACCIEAFVEHQDLSTRELYYLAAINTKSAAKKELNLLEGRQQVSHIPCSLNCPASVLYAKQVLELLDIDPRELAGRVILFPKGSYLALGAEKDGLYAVREMVLSKADRLDGKLPETAFRVRIADKQLFVYSDNNEEILLPDNKDFRLVDFV